MEPFHASFPFPFGLLELETGGTVAWIYQFFNNAKNSVNFVEKRRNYHAPTNVSKIGKTTTE